METHHPDARQNGGDQSEGFAFNCLTSYSDPPKMRNDLFYADPAGCLISANATIRAMSHSCMITDSMNSPFSSVKRVSMTAWLIAPHRNSLPIALLSSCKIMNKDIFDTATPLLPGYSTRISKGSGGVRRCTIFCHALNLAGEEAYVNTGEVSPGCERQS